MYPHHRHHWHGRRSMMRRWFWGRPRFARRWAWRPHHYGYRRAGCSPLLLIPLLICGAVMFFGMLSLAFWAIW
jgi:hypothetical protein